MCRQVLQTAVWEATKFRDNVVDRLIEKLFNKLVIDWTVLIPIVQDALLFIKLVIAIFLPLMELFQRTIACRRISIFTPILIDQARNGHI